MLMFFHLLARAIERGQDMFDFGRSSRDSGTYRFKQQWVAAAIRSGMAILIFGPAGRKTPGRTIRATNGAFGCGSGCPSGWPERLAPGLSEASLEVPRLSG